LTGRSEEQKGHDTVGRL